MSNDTESSDQSLFKAIQREPTLSNRVTDQIESLIIENQLQPGNHLPSERELAQQFGVSRTVIREAIRALSAKGLLEVRSGHGTVVRSPTAEAVAQSMNLFLRAGQEPFDYSKVFEVRNLLEVEIAGLAAERRTAEDLEKMKTILSEAANNLAHENRHHFAKTDVTFHAALAQATHNELFSLLLESLADIMFEIRLTGFDVPNTPTRALADHREILEQIKGGNAEGARQVMREHMMRGSEIQRQAMTLKKQDKTS